MIPFTFNKTIELIIKDNTVENAVSSTMHALANRIKAEKPKSFSNNQNQISFSGGAFRAVSNPQWNILGPITHGTINIVYAKNKLKVSYKLWYTELIILALLVTTFLAIGVFTSGFNFRNFETVTGIWLWLYLGNYLISIVRFNNLINSVVRHVNVNNGNFEGGT